MMGFKTSINNYQNMVLDSYNQGRLFSIASSSFDEAIIAKDYQEKFKNIIQEAKSIKVSGSVYVFFYLHIFKRMFEEYSEEEIQQHVKNMYDSTENSHLHKLTQVIYRYLYKVTVLAYRKEYKNENLEITNINTLKNIAKNLINSTWNLMQEFYFIQDQGIKLILLMPKTQQT
ncbi:hypothetical protein ABPG72_002593 [Tetrahymena utriculariae]